MNPSRGYRPRCDSITTPSASHTPVWTTSDDWKVDGSSACSPFVCAALTDWGYHLTALFGTDYRYTTVKGYWNGQWVNDHHQYGFDPTLEYVDVYMQQVAQGMNLRNLWHINVDVFQGRIEPVLMMIVHPLAVPISLRRRIPIVRAKQSRKVVTPVDVIALHRIRQPLCVENKLVQLKAIRIHIVRFRLIAIGRSAEVQRRIDPSIHLRPARGSVDRRHQWIAIRVRLPNHRRPAI